MWVRGWILRFDASWLARRGRRGVAFSGALLLVLAGCFSGPEPLAGLRLEAPDAVTAGGTARLVVSAIGARGTDPLPGYGGTVRLTVSDGTVVPNEVTLTGGRAAVDVVLGGVVAPVTVTAAVAGIEAEVEVDLRPLPALAGAAGDLAAEAVPFLAFRQRTQDFAIGAVDLPGWTLSFNTVTLALAADATVGAVNALLSRVGGAIVGAVPGRDGVIGAIVVLRLPTPDHAALAPVLAELLASPLVRHAHRESWPPDLAPFGAAAMAPAAATPGNGGVPGDWTWEREDQAQPAPDANWGLERIRVPQAWNANAAAVAATGALTGVLDSGFPDHPDVAFEARLGAFVAPVLVDNDHGLHVSGTIAATFANGVGVDGVNPFARLVGRRFGTGLGWGMVDLLEARDDLRVVNASAGYNWYLRTPPVDPTFDAAAQAQATAQGATFAHYLDIRRAYGANVPLLVVAAGNDSDRAAFRVVDARWGSPFTSTALVHGAADVLVVEAAARSAGVVVPANFSNAGGHVAAPGAAIRSAAATVPYLDMDGTSMATPHVAGLAGLLFALEPALTNAEVVDAIVGTAVTYDPGAAPLVDAFAAVLALDALAGEPRFARALADVDDGTRDGNLRRDPATGAAAPADPVPFGPAGDGVVDLRDFRRFRDALLAVEAPVGLALDGAADHPKRDLNLDGVVQAAAENVFPRFDLNGDGRVDRSATAFVGGVLNAELTDLEVLMAVWDDPDVEASALPALLESGDVHVAGTAAFTDPAVTEVEVTFTPRAGGAESVVQLSAEPEVVRTLPVGTYDVTTRTFEGGLAALDERELTVTLGGDVLFVPRGLALAPLDVVLQPGESVAFVATAYGVGDPGVAWSATGGRITGAGVYTAGDAAGAFEVVATSVAEPGLRAEARVTVVVPTSQVRLERRADMYGAPGLVARATTLFNAAAETVFHDSDADFVANDQDFAPRAVTLSAGGAGSAGGATATASATFTRSEAIQQVGDQFVGLTYAGALDLATSIENAPPAGSGVYQAQASGDTSVCLWFRVDGGDVRFRAQVSGSASAIMSVSASLEGEFAGPVWSYSAIDTAHAASGDRVLVGGGNRYRLCYVHTGNAVWLNTQASQPRATLVGQMDLSVLLEPVPSP